MRGMVAGEKVVSQAQSKAWDENAERAGIGAPASPDQRGTWVWDPKQNKLVRPREKEIDESPEARFAPINCDRHYENVPSPIDGHVFTSRRDHREYMRAHNLAPADDFRGTWEQAEKRRAEPFSSPEERRRRQDMIGRKLYEIEKLPQAKYDRMVEEARRRRLERGPMEPTKD